MTECPICRRRPCAVKGCIRQARPTDITCWHHAKEKV